MIIFDVFEPRVGAVPNYVWSLKLRNDAKSVFLKPQPYALKGNVGVEQDKLLADGTIKEVGRSEWRTSFVVISKSDGTVRLGAYYKIPVNKQLNDSRHPIPDIEDIS